MLLNMGLRYDIKEAGGVLLVGMDGRKMTDGERDAVAKATPVLARMAQCDYSRHVDGWRIDNDFPERVYRVHRGHLLDSVILDSASMASAFLNRLRRGETVDMAYRATMI
jgi:hypothetical protein